MKGELRRRLLRIRPPSVIDRPLRRLLLVQAAWTMGMLWLDPNTRGSDNFILAFIAFGMAWVGAYLQPWIKHRLGPMGQVIDGIVVAASLYPLMLMSRDPMSFGFVLPIVVASVFARRSMADGSAVACAGLLVLASATLAAQLPGKLSGMLALPPLAMGLAVVLWSHARLTRRRLSARIASDFHGHPGWELRARAMLATTIAMLFFLVTLISLRGSEWGQQRWLEHRQARDEAALRASLLEREQADYQERSSNGSRPQRQSGGSVDSGQSSPAPRLERHQVDRGEHGSTYFDNQLSFDGSLVEIPRSQRIELRVITPPSERRRFGTATPAYLMTTSFGDFSPTHLAAANEEARLDHTDFGDGSRDGWTQIQDDQYTGTYLEIEVRCRNLIAPGVGELRHIVPRIEPLIAIRQPSVRRQADGMLTLPNLGDIEQVSRMRCRVPADQLLALRSPVFDTSIASSLALPDSNSNWDSVMDEVRAQVAQLDANEPVLRAVLGHFRRNFRYSLATPGSGIDGIATFLQERQGYCTYFATAAMLMLRELGVPCRVVAGYRVSRWDDDLEGYVAGDQGAHAWVEVNVKGRGWMPFDPTPSSSLERIASQEMSRLEQLEILADLQGVDDELAQQIAAAAENEAGADRPPAAGMDSPQQKEVLIDTSVPRRSGPSLGVIIAVTALSATMLGIFARSRQKDWFAAPHNKQVDNREVTGQPDYQKLILDLARLGMHPHRGQTPLEFAHQVAAHFYHPFPAMVPVVWSLYAKVFGDVPLTTTDRARIDELHLAIKRTK